MGTKTGIEWTDSTWSPVRVQVREAAAAIARDKGYTSLVAIAEKMAGHVGPHCEHVSPGCANCYAESNNHRCLPANGTGLPYDRRSRDLVEAFADEKVLLQPLKWKAIYTTNGRLGAGRWEYVRPRRIFVENQSDLFGEWVADEMLDRVFAVMALCPQHTFQVLTKRPERMLKYVRANMRSTPTAMGGGMAKALDEVSPGYFHRKTWDYRWPLPNVWLGVSVENQAAADERIPLLLQTPAAVRFLSCEPLLGPVKLGFEFGEPMTHIDFLRGRRQEWPDFEALAHLDWVICGGESGPGARPMHPDWARSLRDQCAAAGVPFFFKQWGEWLPLVFEPNGGLTKTPHSKLRTVWPDGGVTRYDEPGDPARGGGYTVDPAGKKAAGALLDGVEHKAFPAVLA